MKTLMAMLILTLALSAQGKPKPGPKVLVTEAVQALKCVRELERIMDKHRKLLTVEFPGGEHGAAANP